jgi:tricorn protease
MNGYYRQPTVFEDRVVFVSEDDLWEVSLGAPDENTGIARRLTSGKGAVSYPAFSPDGAQIAFTATEEGTPEVYIMDAGGGSARQLTFNGGFSTVVGWSKDGSEVLFRSNYREPFSRSFALYGVPIDGGESARVPVGPAHSIAYQSDGHGAVLCRHSDDVARWKRYRGGTAGVLWVDADGSSAWERILPEYTAGLVRPMWIGERVYFITDEEGYGNIYSCLPDGSDVTRHTDHVGFYARFANTDGQSIVYSVGGDLWRLDVASGESAKIACDYASPRTDLNRKFVDAEDYLDDFALHPKGHSLAVTSRGKLFNFGNWEGAVRQSGEEQGVRYRLAQYLDAGERIVVASDATGGERFEIHRTDGSTGPTPVEAVSAEKDDFDIGRPIDVKVSPKTDALIFSNHRHELVHLDLESGEAKVLDKSEYTRLNGFDISSDGRWIAYGFGNDFSTGEIRLYDLQNGAWHRVTSGNYLDVQPVFDPKGRYLYFLSYRKFNPVYDEVFFELSFPRAMKPCVITLRDDLESPFIERPRPLDGDHAEEDDEDNGDESEAEADDTEDANDQSIDIDLEGIEHRVEVFPGREGSYSDIGATENRVFWTVYPITGSLGQGMDRDLGAQSTLKYFSLKKRRVKTFAKGVSEFVIGPDHKTMAMWTECGLQVVSASGEGPIHDDSDDDRPSRRNGFVDLERLSVSVEPRAEWGQMLHEAWRLMRDHFWREDMSGVDWDEVWQRYSPLLDRVSTRSEFSDVVWTMQGELGTSHAYEMGGDYPSPPQYQPGFLGAEVAWDASFEYERGEQSERGGYRIGHIIAGESWEPKERSPLARPGVGVQEGDVIVAINGQRVSEHVSVDQRLVNRAGQEVELAVVDADSGVVETHTVKTLRSEFRARYREWVLQNRQKVHEASDGQIGYVHIPDMGPFGFSEFHRAYLSENTKKGLVVDVRFNGGGHVSQLILEKLARPRLGYDIQRWGKPLPYPQESIMGPMVALTNEHAGSDGDIFSHCFKLMELGPLLGKRTWGGVIGIWPRHYLVDGSITTQPEFSFWFKDVGFGVENYGTDPDVEVEFPPGADARGDDPQLEAAIERAMAMVDEEKPEVPEFGPYPTMRPPEKLD